METGEAPPVVCHGRIRADPFQISILRHGGTFPQIIDRVKLPASRNFSILFMISHGFWKSIPRFDRGRRTAEPGGGLRRAEKTAPGSRSRGGGEKNREAREGAATRWSRPPRGRPRRSHRTRTRRRAGRRRAPYRSSRCRSGPRTPRRSSGSPPQSPGARRL